VLDYLEWDSYNLEEVEKGVQITVLLAVKKLIFNALVQAQNYLIDEHLN